MQEQKTRQLLEQKELRDRKSSQFLQYATSAEMLSPTPYSARSDWVGQQQNSRAANLAHKVLELSSQLNVAAYQQPETLHLQYLQTKWP